MNSKENLPQHLVSYIAEQEYDRYTAIDHACWRFIMRISKEFFKDHAHPIYVRGLEATGITIEQIPRVSEMNEKLSRFGWRAVPITGFIPTAAFLEMLSDQILPIACDMRKIENIDYTPSPDIVHEAAGHAPIIADPSYSSYLQKFGEVARKVIISKEDEVVYDAVLNLSEVKEDPAATDEDIERAQKQLDDAISKVTFVSEAQRLSRLGWWSTEYGLFQQESHYLIYGAGLLSSVGESYNCLRPEVPKIPLTIQCTETDFDITKPQPQLFCIDDFKKLEDTLEELASQMSYRKGGIEALREAERSANLTTAEFETGLQVSGFIKEIGVDKKGALEFIEYRKGAQLSYQNKQVVGPKTLDSAVKMWVGKSRASTIPGSVVGIWRRDEHLLGTQVQNGTVTVLWLNADRVVSVYRDAADRSAYAAESGSKNSFKVRRQKSNLTPANAGLVPLYQRLRDLREDRQRDPKNESELKDLHARVKREFPEDWLLRMEILEIARDREFAETLKTELQELAQLTPVLSMLISRGLSLIQ